MLTAAHVRRHWAVFLGLVVALAVWCAVDVSRRARVDRAHPGLHMTDVTVYTEAGLAFFDGREPYEVANIRGWKYLYPPLFALVVAPLGQLAPQWQATVWFAISALMAFGIYFECRRLLRLFGWGESAAAGGAQRPVGWVERSEAHPPAASRSQAPLGNPPFEALLRRLLGVAPQHWIFVAAAVAALFPALNCLQRGQMGVALLYFLLLGFRLVAAGERPLAWLVGGVILALPVVLKFTPFLPVGCALLLLLIAAMAARGRQTPTEADNAGVRLPLQQPNLHPAALAIIRSRAERAVRSGSARFLWSTAGCLAGGAFFLILLPATLIGWNSNLRHLTTWYHKVATKVDDVRTEDFGSDVDSPRNQSLANAAYRCGNWLAYEFAGGPYDQLTGKAHGKMPMDAPTANRLLLLVRCIALLALLGVTIRAGLSENQLLWGGAFGLAAVATLVVSPVARGHYFVFLLPAGLCIPLWLLEQGKTRAALRTALVPALLVVAHYALLRHTGRIGLLGIGTTLWYFAACARIALHHQVASASIAPHECRLRQQARAA